MHQSARTGVIVLGLVLLQVPECLQAAAAATDLQEVVVTARKRAESLQDVPISISAISAQTLEDQSAIRFQDSLNSVPNVSWSSDDIADAKITIRGISSDTNNFGIEPAVGVYMDEVYIPRPTAVNQMALDIDRVEVLRGPQGTLFGRNTVAGVISIVTEDPTPAWRAEGDLTGGRYDLLQARASLSGPLSERTGIRLSAGRLSQKGWFNQSTPGFPDFGGEDSWTLRAKVRFKPTDSLDLVASVGYVRDDAVIGNNLIADGPLAGINGGVIDSIGTNVDNFARRRLWMGSLRANWDLPGHTLTAITGYSSERYESFKDQDYTPLDILATGEPENFHFFSQELRLTSTGQEALSYIGGVYFSRMTLSGNTHAELGADVLPAIGFPSIPGYRESEQTNSHLLQKSYAAFGSVSYKASARVALTAGLRYTDERKTLDYDQTVSPFFIAPDTPVGLIYAFAQDVAPLRQNYSKGVLSGDATASYQWNHDVQSYLRFSRGYKAGGFDTTQSSTSDPGSRAFKPEFVNLYEIGFKSLFAGRRVKINGAIFYSQYQDKQEQVFNGTDFATNNAATARSQGAEVEVTLLLGPGLELYLGVGFADAKYGEFVDKLSGEDYSGNRLPLAARWSVDSSLQYRRPVLGDWGVVSRVEGEYHSDSFTTSDNDPNFQQRGKLILNLRLGWERSDQSLGIYAWGRNVTDARFVTGGFNFIGNTFISRNRPTMWGVELRGKW